MKFTGWNFAYEYHGYEVDGETAVNQNYLMNVLENSWGNTKEYSDVTSSLKITDGALIVVDYLDGFSMDIEPIMRQALCEKIKPVLFINKIDKGIHDLQ